MTLLFCQAQVNGTLEKLTRFAVSGCRGDLGLIPVMFFVLSLVLSSIVDHKSETAWADRMRARGVPVGFIGIAAAKMPQLFRVRSRDLGNQSHARNPKLGLCFGLAAQGLVKMVSYQDEDRPHQPEHDHSRRDEENWRQGLWI